MQRKIRDVLLARDVTAPASPRDTWTDELFTRPGHLIRRCYQILMALSASSTKDQGVTQLQYAVLRTIKNQPTESKRRLGEVAGLDRTTIGWVIESLEKKGLIACTAESKHKRIKYFQLSPLGAKTLAVMDPRLDAMQDLLLDPLDPEERIAFVRSMQKIVTAYNEYSRAPLRPGRAGRINPGTD